jgi:GTPase involved in cell partitioning and DNA repair
MNFMKVFQKIILLLYKSKFCSFSLTVLICICIWYTTFDSQRFACLADVLSEDTVLKWYKGGHAAKGKSVFLEQMKKMVEWLQSAEEGNSMSFQNLIYTIAWLVLNTWPADFTPNHSFRKFIIS